MPENGIVPSLPELPEHNRRFPCQKVQDHNPKRIDIGLTCQLSSGKFWVHVQGGSHWMHGAIKGSVIGAGLD